MANLKPVHFIPVYGALKVEQLTNREDMILTVWQILSTILTVIFLAWLTSHLT